MEKVKNYITIVAIIIVVAVVAIGVFYFGKNSNNNQTSTTTSVQSAQDQCGAKAKEMYNSVVAEFKQKNEAKYGVGAIDTYDYASHYNKSMSACIMSLHESLYSAEKNVQLDLYFVFNADNKTQIGTLYQGTMGTNKMIYNCVVNSLPCTSVDQYTSMTAPYLNN